MASTPITIAPGRQNLTVTETFEPNIRVATINDDLLCFYDGREIDG